MKRTFVGLALLAFLGAATLASGAGMIVVEDSSWWPGPVPPGPVPAPWPGRRPMPYRFAPLEVESVKVQTQIRDQVATTSVDQEFYNPNSARLEGTFIFPVPRGAHLDKFSMEIDGKSVDAELLNADKARGIYENIVRKLRDPALLEYAGLDVFKVRVFPIEPNSRKHVSFTYTELLKSDNQLVCFTLPLSTEKFSCKPVKKITVQVDLKTKRPLQSIYSPSHTVEVHRDGPNHATASYEHGQSQAEPDFTLYFATEKEELGLNLLTHRVAGEDGYFLLLASPGMDLKSDQVVPKDIVFVLDTSGSMAGKKLEQGKKALEFCLENLNDEDRFELIRFSTEVEPLFGRLVSAEKNHHQKAAEFVERLRPMGATAIDDALSHALRLQADIGTGEQQASKGRAVAGRGQRPFVIMFLTDGRPTIGLTEEDQIVSNVKKKADGHTRIFCFGIGTDVNTHLLDRITETTRGFSQYVLPEEDLEVKVSSFYSKIKEPTLTNPTLEFSGGVRPAQLYPSALPDLFKGEQLVVVGRYSGQGDAAALLAGTMRGGFKKTAYDLHFPAESAENDFIPRLWATRRVGYLLDEIRLHGDNAELRDEVTELARRYSIVTPYTAYLIVEDEQKRDVPAQIRSLPALQQDRQARAEVSRSWNQFTTDRDGDSGVAGAMSGLALKSANAAAPATLAAEAQFARRYGFDPNRADASKQERTQLRLATEGSRFVNGKSFFQNGAQWVDTAVQKLPQATVVRLQFGSNEYFEFVDKNPGVTGWLSLGQNVRFVWNNAVYEIYE